MEQTLYLHRVRDFGEKVSDTFLFLKRNWQKLFGVYAVFVVPFIIIAGIAGVMLAGRLYANSLSSTDLFRYSDILSLDLFVILICIMAAAISYITAVFSYITLYDQQRGVQPTIAQVGQVYFRKLPRLFLYNIVVGFILLLVFIIPYLIVSFIPLLGFFGQILLGALWGAIHLHLNLIYIREEQGMFEGVSRVFYLFSNNWWKTIGFTIIMMIIYYVFTFVLVLIIGLIGVLIYTSFILQKNTGGGFGKSGVTLVSLGIGFFFLLQQVFYLILFCAAGINYFSLVEEKDGSAIEEQIENIGGTSDKYGGIEEQY